MAYLVAMIIELTVRFEKKKVKKKTVTRLGCEHLPSSPTNHARLLAINYGDVCESFSVYDARNRLVIMSITEF